MPQTITAAKPRPIFVSLSGIGLHKLHLAACKELIEPYTGHKYDVYPQAGKENSESAGLGNGDCTGLRVFHVADFIGACALAKAAAEALVKINAALTVFIKAHCSNGAGFYTSLTMRAFVLFELGKIWAVIVHKRDMVFCFQRQRHTAAGAAEAQIVLIRLNAGFNDGNETAFVCHIRNSKAFINGDRTFTVLFLELAIEIKTETGVDGIVAVTANCAAHTR